MAGMIQADKLTRVGMPPEQAKLIAAIAGTGAGLAGTVVLAGATPVTVVNTNVAVGDAITFTLQTAGGTVGGYPNLKTITPGVGFTVAGTASDTSTYAYRILKA